MARSVKNITETYQSVSAGAAVFSFKKKGKGTLFINTVNTDDDAAEEFSSEENERQAQQQSAVETFIRANDPDEGWVVIVDE